MATQDTTGKDENDENTKKGVEPEKSEDETTKENSQEAFTDTGKEQEDGETKDDESKDEGKTEEESKIEFKKRFTQLKGETPEEYLKNLEDAYANSSTEGQRTAKEAKEATEKFAKVASLIASDPELAEKLNDMTDGKVAPIVTDPATKWAKEQMDKEFTKDYTAFTDTHPEMISDETIRTSVIDELDVIAAAYEARGKVLSMADGLRKAWISLGYDEKDNKEDVVNKTKEEASSSSSQTTTKKPDDKPKFTEGQLKMAEKMGLTPKQLAKYNK
jgi:hypothetical protein